MYDWGTKMFNINIADVGAIVISLCRLRDDEIVRQPCLAQFNEDTYGTGEYSLTGGG